MKRFSFNVNGQRVGNEAYFLDFIRQYKPTTLLVMDDLDLADKAYVASEGQTKVVYRAYSEDDGSAWGNVSPADFATRLLGGNKRHIYRYILNEPLAQGADVKRLTDFLNEVMDRLRDAGQPAVSGNIGPATWREDDIEAGRWDSYLRKLAEHKGFHFGGWHEYTGILLPFGVGQWPVNYLDDPSKIQKSSWLSPEQLPIQRWNGNLPPYWHLLRSCWFDIRAREQGIPLHDKWITEFGWDRMPDMTSGGDNIFARLQQRYGVPSPHTTVRGAYSLKNVWNGYFPNWTFQQAVIEQWKWADTIYPANYIGFNSFTWAFDNEWDVQYGFNYGRDQALHQVMLSQITLPQPVPPPPTVLFPPASDPRWIDATIVAQASQGARLRAQPSITASINGILMGSEAGRIAVEAAYTAEGYKWYPVVLANILGWAREDVVGWVVNPTMNEHTLIMRFQSSDADYDAIKAGLAAIGRTQNWRVE